MSLTARQFKAIRRAPHADCNGFAYSDLVCACCRFIIATTRVAAVDPPNGEHDQLSTSTAGRRNQQKLPPGGFMSGAQPDPLRRCARKADLRIAYCNIA